jgi:predicted dehydrogenase
MSDLGWGIVGCGGAALDVAEALDTLAGVKVAATFDANRANAESLAAPRGAKVHDTLASLLADAAVDIVYIALPHFLLEGVAKQALEASKHVLVEKPMALTTDGIAGLGRLAKAGNLQLGVYFELRRAATIEAARELVRGGAIGKVRMVRVTTIVDKPQSYWTAGYSGRSVSNWRTMIAQAGGGVVLMNSIHHLDAVRFITGLDFTRASGSIATLGAEVEVEDTASAAITLSNGAILNLAAAAHSPGAHANEGIELDGDKGRIDIHNIYGAGSIGLYSAETRQWVDIPTPKKDAYAAMLGDFAEAVHAGGEPTATATDAFAALSVVQAIYESSRTGSAVNIGSSASNSRR